MKKCITKHNAGWSNLGLGRSRQIEVAKKKHDSQCKSCPQCGEPIPYELRYNKFCSHSCSAKFFNRSRIVTKNCKECGRQIPRARIKTKAKYCGHPCQRMYWYKDYIRMWLDGKLDGVVGHGMAVSAHIKRWLREQRGDRCELCGWDMVNEYTKRRPLQVDHLDGNPLNNHPDNLRLLCPNCHSLTPTFGGRNSGRGRKARRDRYAKERGIHVA